MKKNQTNMPLFWGSVVLLLIVLVAVAVNYIGNLSRISQTNAIGLELTDGKEEYICNESQKLIVEIIGSEKNIKNRTANATVIDDYSGPAGSPNMKLKEVVNGATKYVYKENSLVIDKDGKATLFIFNKMLAQPKDIAVVEDCIKVKNSKK